ncbi:Prophage CP4-57 regulatory protein (AlpA) [Succinivibrio dextrinosolvens DSM 3072]|uniref:Prophage CP4-57 regulatory protein (AlpA) n=1 Tax=Succinivibrio dextrinosolvens DSM 3072 TaxID=1123324 RepID=A0A1T4VMH8_9GAMM|nr:AlpA family phage regulatory protein [Succinivibrio dextrinosolvens]SKA66192.1 Prophage CP4-57 regulatory protein (AlpA) [Succinivibrio dextrinosolvens DSM 3072]
MPKKEELTPVLIVNEKIFVNSTEIMKLFEITRPTLEKWKKTTSFPKAICLARRPVWMTEEILDWAKSHRIENPLSKEMQ